MYLLTILQSLPTITDIYKSEVITINTTIKRLDSNAECNAVKPFLCGVWISV